MNQNFSALHNQRIATIKPPETHRVAPEAPHVTQSSESERLVETRRKEPTRAYYQSILNKPTEESAP